VFPPIPTVANGRIAGLNQLNTTATLTGPNLTALTGRQAGDLVIAIAGEYQSNAGADAAFTGWAGGGLTWNEIRDSTGTANGRLGVAYARLATGSESGAVTVTRSGTLVGDAAMILMCIPGAHVTTAPEASVAVHGATADPAAFNPAGWDIEDTLWIGVNGAGLTVITGTWTGIDGAPTNYTDLFDTNAADTSVVGDFSLGAAFRQNAVASEDMGPFTTDTSNNRNSALVIAVRPAPYVPQNYDETGRLCSIAVTVSATDKQWPIKDVFTGTNGDAPNSAIWTRALAGTAAIDIQGNKLSFRPGVNGNEGSVLANEVMGDQEILALVELTSDNEWLWLSLRSSTGAKPLDQYIVEITADPNPFNLYRRDNDVGTFLDAFGTTGDAFVNGERKWVRFQAFGVGATVFLKFRQWPEGTTEPSTWDIEFDDTHANRKLSGRAGFVAGSSSRYLVDEVSIYYAQQPSPPGGPETFDETNRLCSIAVTVTETEVAHRSELDRPVTAAVTVTTADVMSRPISELTDDFPGSTLDSQWTNSSTPATVSGGVAHLNPPAASDYVSITSVDRYNVFGSSYWAEFVPLPVNSPGASNQSGIGLRKDANNTIEFGLWGVNLGYILTGSLAVDNDSGFIAYNATDHRWLRIRADATTLYFDTSPDGNTWTERFSHAMVSYGVGAVQANAFAGWWDAGDSDSGEATIDKVNTSVGPQTFDETGRTCSIAVTVATVDVQAYKELDKLVTSAVTVTRTDTQAHKELDKLVTTAVTVTATGIQVHRDLNRTVTTAVTVTCTDTMSGIMNETNRLVSIPVTVSGTDVQAMKELDRAVNVAATITAPSTQAYKELERAVSIAATISATAALHLAELSRLVALAVATSSVNVQAHKELARSTTATVTVTATDVVYSSAQEFRTVTLAVTVTAVDVVHRLELDRFVLAVVTVTAQSTQHNADLALPVLVTATVSAVSVQHMAELARALTVLVSVLATDFYRPQESLAPWHQPAGTITSRTPNGSVNSASGGSTISDVIPDTTITDRRG
jgi:hypothetical protein